MVHEICWPSDRHSSSPSHLKARSGPCACQLSCALPTKHQLGIVALISCCTVRLSPGGQGPSDKTACRTLPACALQSICRGAIQESRFDPLAFIGDTRPLHRTFFAVLNGASITDPEPVHVASDPQKWAYGQSTSVRTAKHVISACISFLARAACVPLLDRLPERVAHDLCRDTNTVACLCAKGVALQTGLRRATYLTGLQTASWTFALSKDENLDRFIGDRRSMNSRERSIGLGTSETMQKNDARHQGLLPQKLAHRQ